jgi:hypothetical membrane protein
MMRSLRLAGVAAVIVLWTTLPAGAALSGFDLLGEDPLSYLGTQAASALLFTGGLAVSGVLLVAFHEHLRDRYAVSGGFSAAMLIGLAGQLVAAFVPIGGDQLAHRIHTTSALVLGASLPVFMWRFAAAQPGGRLRGVAYGLFWAEVAACVAGLYLSSRHVAPVAEVLPAGVFHIWIIVLTVLHPNPHEGALGRHPVVRDQEEHVPAGRRQVGSGRGLHG